MASTNKPTTFGATIVPRSTNNSLDLTLPPAISNSPSLTPAVSREDLDAEFSERRIPAHSPFYQHPPASFERHSRNTSKVDVPLDEKDLEAGIRTPLSADTPFTSKVSVDCNKECRMWPSKQTVMQAKLAEKKKKRDNKMCGGCGPVIDYWGRFTKRQKLVIKIALALFLIGAVTAIAVGISIAVHGTVYAGDGETHKIPNPASD